MTSQIDPTVPVFGTPTTASVRSNFATAAAEITDLQSKTTGGPFLPLGGSHMSGPMYLWNDPTDVMMPATKGYVDSHSAGGGGGIPEAPSDGQTYGRNQGAWTAAVPLAGTTMVGPLILSGAPTAANGAVTKAYADTIGTTASGAVQKAGDTMTGLLVLSGPPTAANGAVTKAYADSALALKANAASPTFTGTVTMPGRVFVTAPDDAAIIFNSTQLNAPVFGVRNFNGLLQWGLAAPSTGNMSTQALALDSSGNFTVNGNATVLSGRIVSRAGSNPSIGLNSTNQGTTWGLWHNGNLAVGATDPAGNPSSTLYQFRNVGIQYDCVGGANAIGFSWNGSYPTAVIDNSTRCNLVFDGYPGSVTIGGAVSVAGLLTGNGGINCGGTGIEYTGVPGATTNRIAFRNSGAGYISWFVDNNASGDIVHNGYPGTVSIGGGFNCGAFTCGSATLATGSLIVNSSGIDYVSIGPGNVGAFIGFNTPGSVMHGYSNGGDYGAIQFTGCDRRIKENIAPVAGDPLAALRQIKLHSFDRHHPADRELPTVHHDVGFIAQELRPIIKEAVLPTEGKDDLVCVDLVPLVAYLIGGVQQLADRLDTLERTRK